MTKTRPAVFLKSMIALGFILIGGIYLLTRADKPKEGFKKISGSMVHYATQLGDATIRPESKTRFLQLNNSNIIFSLFIGKDKGDFKPEFEMLDSLKIGDVIDLYYDENVKGDPYADKYTINHLAQYIDRDGKPIFIKGGMVDKIGGVFAVAASLVMFVVLSLLKRAGKIL